MTKAYLVKLKPIGEYYFGNEKTFGSTDTYLVKSNPFPQQTSLLGMIRKEIIIQHGVFKENINNYTDEEKAKNSNLIGTKSYNIEDDEFKFGKIMSISPVFLMYKKDYIFKAPFNTVLKEKNEKRFLEIYEERYITEDMKLYINDDNDKMIYLDGYEGKKGLNTDFLKFDNKEVSPIRFDEIFTQKYKIGIEKNIDGGASDEAYYKVLYYTLNKDYSFSFFIELEDIQLKDNIVTLGGLSSSFYMKVEEVKIGFDDVASKFKEALINSLGCKFKNKIILISDAFLSDVEKLPITFSISEEKDFRNILTHYNKEKSRKYLKGSHNLTKTSKVTLYKNGSVFYTDEKEKLINIMEKKSIKAIGLNYYI